jgi:hypothetical protein
MSARVCMSADSPATTPMSVPPETAAAVAADYAAAVAEADAFDACVLAVEALELALEA